MADEQNKVPSIEDLLNRSKASSTVLRTLLGATLRGLRNERGITTKEAAKRLGCSDSKISRMENGRGQHRLQVGDVLNLMRFYGTRDESRLEGIADLVRRANEQGWWHQFRDVTATWVANYFPLEAAASDMWVYETHHVPGLLQTREYAEAVIWSGFPLDPAESVARRVELRMRRQEVLTRPEDPLELWVLIDESVLHRVVGNPGVTARQFEHLAEMTKLPHVFVSIVPYAAGAVGMASGPITYLRFPEQDRPDMVYLEHPHNALYLDDREQVDHYRAVLDAMAPEALSREETIQRLREAADRLR